MNKNLKYSNNLKIQAVQLVMVFSEMLLEQKKTNERLSHLELKFDSLEKRLENVEKQQAKTNLAIGELQLSILKFAEKINHQEIIEKRVTKLEKLVFKH